MSRSISAGSSSRADSPRAVISRRSGPPGRVPTSSRTPASAVSLASRRSARASAGGSSASSSASTAIVNASGRSSSRSIRPSRSACGAPAAAASALTHLVGRGGAGVDRDVDDAGGRPATGSSAASGPGMPARYRGSDMVTSRASTADFPDPGPPVTTRTLSAGVGCGGQPGHQLRQRLAAAGEEPAGPGSPFHPAAAGIPVLLQRPLTGQPGPSLVGDRRRGQDRQRVWVGHPQQVPPVRRRRQPGEGGDRHNGQRRLSLRPVMRGDDPDGQLTAVRVSGEHDRPGHALPRRPGQRSRQRLRGAGHLQGKQPRPQLRARQDVAANLPGLPATALRQDRTGFAEPGKPDRPAARYRRRTVPVDPRETDRRQMLIKPRGR